MTEMEEPLFKVSTAYTLSQYRNYNRTVQRENGLNRKLVLSMLLYVGLGVLMSVLFHSWFLFIPLAVLGVLNYYMSLKGIRRAEMAQYQQEQLVGTVNYEFYPDRVDVTTINGKASNYFSNVYTVLENDVAFYIMMAKNSGIILPKEDCTQSLEEFLRSSLKIRKVRSAV